MGGPGAGGMSPVAEHGMQMIQAYVQNPTPEAKAELAAIAQAITQVIQQGGEQGAPQSPPPGGPPPGAMGGPTPMQPPM
jgi:hypothetical protein